MTDFHLEATALVAMVVSLPLVSWGTTQDVVPATVLGAVLLVVGLALLTLLRFLDLGGDE